MAMLSTMKWEFLYPCVLLLLIIGAVTGAGATEEEECYITTDAVQYDRILLPTASDRCFSRPVEVDAETACECAAEAVERKMNTFEWTGKCDLYYKVAPHDEAGTRVMYTVEEPLPNSRNHHFQFVTFDEAENEFGYDILVPWTLSDLCRERDTITITKKLTGSDTFIPHEDIPGNRYNAFGTHLVNSEVCRVDELLVEITLTTSSDVITETWVNPRIAYTYGIPEAYAHYQSFTSAGKDRCYAVFEMQMNYKEALEFCWKFTGSSFDGGFPNTLGSDVSLDDDVWIGLAKNQSSASNDFYWDVSGGRVPPTSNQWSSDSNPAAASNACAYLSGAGADSDKLHADSCASLHTVACVQTDRIW